MSRSSGLAPSKKQVPCVSFSRCHHTIQVGELCHFSTANNHHRKRRCLDCYYALVAEMPKPMVVEVAA